MEVKKYRDPEIVHIFLEKMLFRLQSFWMLETSMWNHVIEEI